MSHNVFKNLVKKVGEGIVEKKFLCSRYSGKSNQYAVFVWDSSVTTDIPSDAFRKNFNATKLCCSANAVMTEMDKFGQAIIKKIEFTVKLPQTNSCCVVELYGAEAFMDKYSPLYVVNWQSFATALKSNALVRQVSLALVSQAKKRAVHGAGSAAVTVGTEDPIVCSNFPVSTVNSSDEIVQTNTHVSTLISSHTVIPAPEKVFTVLSEEQLIAKLSEQKVDQDFPSKVCQEDEVEDEDNDSEESDKEESCMSTESDDNLEPPQKSKGSKVCIRAAIPSASKLTYASAEKRSTPESCFARKEAFLQTPGQRHLETKKVAVHAAPKAPSEWRKKRAQNEKNKPTKKTRITPQWLTSTNTTADRILATHPVEARLNRIKCPLKSACWYNKLTTVTCVKDQLPWYCITCNMYFHESCYFAYHMARFPEK